MATATESNASTSLARLDQAVGGLDPDSAKRLRAVFESMFARADEWIPRALAIRVDREDQVREMKLARESRLALRELRINVEHERKRLKEDSLRQGKAIDGLANVFKALVEPIEEHLLVQEKFAERACAARADALRSAREASLRAYGSDPVAFADLGTLSEEGWSHILDTARLAHEARLEEARRAEAARVEAERLAAEEAARAREEAAHLEAERAERERLQREENTRLRREAEEREAAARVERERVEAERRAERERAAAARAEAEAAARKAEQAAAAERAARAKAEAELARKREAEEAERARAERERRAAEAAPDAEKLSAIAAAVRAIPMPSMSTEAGIDGALAASKALRACAEAIERAAAGMLRDAGWREDRRAQHRADEATLDALEGKQS